MSEMHPLPSPLIYYAHPRYRILALVSLIAVVYVGWEFARSSDPAALFFLVVCLGLLVWNLRSAMSVIVLGADQVVVKQPLQPDSAVAFRQLMSVEEGGRMSRSILLMYHPRQTGKDLLDLEDVRSLYFPTVTGQEELLAHLKEQVPG